MASIRFSVHIFFSSISDSHIIKLTPLLLISVIDECIVVATLGASIVHADCMQVVLILIHVQITLLNLLV